MYDALFLDETMILIGVEMSVLGADGKVYIPDNSYDYSQVMVIIAKYNGTSYEWDGSMPLTADPLKESTRGLMEPTLAKLSDGRIIMVMRGSNMDKNYQDTGLPSLIWYSLSSDKGKTWSNAKPWIYDDLQPIFAPSAISKFVRHSSGRLFWLGNVRPNDDAVGNESRYPLVIGEVDKNTGMLIRSSMVSIVDRQTSMSDKIQFSNFTFYEDRVTREIVVDIPFFYPNTSGTAYTGDLYKYRITIH